MTACTEELCHLTFVMLSCIISFLPNIKLSGKALAAGSVAIDASLQNIGWNGQPAWQLAGPLALVDSGREHSQPYWLGYANGWGFAPWLKPLRRVRPSIA